MTDRTDSNLLGEYSQSGCEAAFSELVRRHIDLVYSAALRMVVDPHLAQDVTQGVFVALACNARRLTDRAVLSSWLHRTAQNLAAKAVRSEVRRRMREQEAFSMQTLQPDPEPNWKQVAPVLDSALGQLANADRDVLMLRFFEKKTAREIAVRMTLSEEAAQKRVTRALDKLRTLLARHDITLSATTLATVLSGQAVAVAPIGLSTAVSAAALASAAAGGMGLATISSFTMSKLKITTVSALLAAGIATPLVLQHQTLTKLREENEVLREQNQRAITLEAQNESLSNQLTSARQSLSREQLSELMRLRSEVGPLRRESQELARVRTEQDAHRRAASGEGINAVQNAIQECRNNLRQIVEAKEQWALENKKTDRALPAIGDLVFYLAGGRFPKCPVGGTYDIKTVAENPTCSVPGHTIGDAAASSASASFIPAVSWANAGTESPEAALQTFFWAGRNNATDLVAGLLRWQRDPEIPASDELDQKFAQSMISGTSSFAGSLQSFRVTSQETDGDDNMIRLGIHIVNKGGRVEPHLLRFVREGNQWFPVMHVWLQDQGSIRAALDVPPKFSAITPSTGAGER